MAAPPYNNSPFPANGLLFDIYTDGATAASPPPVPPPANLPGGPCGFVDLTPGANGARCGCRRFWSRPHNYLTPSTDQPFWCMCSHHACYHEDRQLAQSPQIQTPALPPLPSLDREPFAGQENERPRGNREPLTPVQGIAAFQTPPGLGMPVDWPAVVAIPASSAAAATEHRARPTSLPPQSSSSSSSSSSYGQQATQASGQGQQKSLLPDTLPWNNMAPNSADGAANLPPIPSQCLFQSQPKSTASSSHTGYLRPFGGKGLHTMGGIVDSRHPGSTGPGRDPDHSSQEEDPDATIPFSQSSPKYAVPMPSAPTPRAAASQEESCSIIPSGPGSSFGSCGREEEGNRALEETVRSHGQRLNKLENQSFSAAGHEDCSEKHDHADLRLTELESRVDDVEKRLTDDNSTVVSNSNHGTTNSESGDRPAFSDYQLYRQLQQLQAQVNRLQACSLPTYTSPWVVEVVVMPFPLKRIWMPADGFPSERPVGAGATGAWETLGDEWTQLPNTHRSQSPGPQTSLVADWLSQSPSPAWLLPRACAPGSVIDERLRSRGLVKTITIKGSDARTVHIAITTAFNDVLQVLQVETASHRSSPVASAIFDKFLGLSLPWVPLRKLHKDSRLRFLSPAEMLTPTLWDAAFLMSSVVMKATGRHRLYVTQPEAYVQDKIASNSGSGWSWQKLRELAPAQADSQESSTSTVEIDEDEQCWQWNDRLDELPAVERTKPPVSAVAVPTAAAAAARSRSMATSSSQQFFTAQSPATTRAMSPALLRDRRGSRPPQIRAVSMPQVEPAAASPAEQSSRVRVSSFAVASSKPSPLERRASPLFSRPSPRLQTTRHVTSEPAIAQAAGAVKRLSGNGRVTTRSPTIWRRNTPRRSSNSIRSRSSSVALREISMAPEDQRMRGTTPFCYATPYSNAPTEAPRHAGEAPYAAPNAPARQTSDFDEQMDYRNYNSGSDSDYDEDADDDRMSEMFHEALNHDDEGDINVYEDEAATDPSNEDARASLSRHSQLAPPTLEERSSQIAPEDEPWPGIEDNTSDGENMDPDSQDHDIQDAPSDVSSQPSEYPSTHRAWQEQIGAAERQQWRTDGGEEERDNYDDYSDDVGFRIHEDFGDGVDEPIEMSSPGLVVRR